MANVNVIDISEWQDPGTFDYAAAKAAGIKTVIIRLSTGLRADKAAAQHIANCDKYGLIWHGYHYWYNQDGEAAFAVKNAQQLGLASTKRLFLDMEDKSLDANWANQFESFRQTVGSTCRIGLYCSDYPFKQHFDLQTLRSEGVYLWIASYSYEPANYDIWQVSGAGGGGFGSYTGDVDRDTDKTGELIEDQTPQPPDIPTEKTYQQIVLEYGYDTETGIYGRGYSYDNGKTFRVLFTVYGWHLWPEDGEKIWKYIMPKITSYTTAGGLWTTSTGDMDNEGPGLHYLTSSADQYQNLPSGAKAPGILSVLQISGASWQTYVALAGDAAMYYRVSTDGKTWQKWQKLGAGGGSGGGGKTTALDDGTDLNTIKDNGTYSSDAVTLNNGPLSASDMMGHFWILNVSFSTDGTYGVQKMMCDSGDEYARFYVSGTWRDWSHATYFD